MELVSILIPAYNAAKWIQKAIESALIQSWPRKELIVIDDGSKDCTFEIASSFSSTLVLVVKQANRGASAARNRALSLAQGDYIQWLDADDMLAPDKLARQMEVAETGRTSRLLLSGAWGKFYYRPEKTSFAPDSLWQDLAPAEWLFRKMDENLWMAIESWLVSRKLIEMAGPWDERLSLDDDGEYFCRVISCATSIKFVPESRCFCRRSNFGISHGMTLNDRKLDSLAVSIFSHINQLRSMEDSLRTRAVCLKLLNRLAIYFYPERPDLLEEMMSLAGSLGGKLTLPNLRPKYRWLQKALGWQVAKKAHQAIPTIRSLAEAYAERLS